LHGWLRASYPRIAATHDVDSLRAHRNAVAHVNPQLKHDVSMLRILALRELALAHDYPLSLAEEGLAVFRRHRNRVRMHEGVVELLKRLRGRYRLGSISNGNADLKEIGIAHLFDFSVFATDVGAAKPDERVYQAAAEGAGVAASSIAHIGDDPDTDVLGAARAGFRAVWLNPGLKPWPGGPQPDAVIRSLKEIECLLGV
jgi:putative hydrolase of the HAD superfamily